MNDSFLKWKLKKKIIKGIGKWEPKQLQLDKYKSPKPRKTQGTTQIHQEAKENEHNLFTSLRATAGSFYFCSCFSFGWESITTCIIPGGNGRAGEKVKRAKSGCTCVQRLAKKKCLLSENTVCLCIRFCLLIGPDSYHVLTIVRHNNVIELWAGTSPNQQWQNLPME